MTIKLVLPKEEPHTNIYTHAKAESAFLAVDALQKKYSTLYKPFHLYANWPRNLEKYLTMIKSDRGDGLTIEDRIRVNLENTEFELLEALIALYPGVQVTVPLTLARLGGENAAIMELLLKHKVCRNESEIRDELSVHGHGLDLVNNTATGMKSGYATAWREHLGFYPACVLWPKNPAGSAPEVFKLMRRACIIEEGTGSSYVPYHAARLFSTTAELLRYYKAACTVNGPSALSGAVVTLCQRYMLHVNGTHTHTSSDVERMMKAPAENLRRFTREELESMERRAHEKTPPFTRPTWATP